MHLTIYALDSLLSMQLEDIFGCRNYLCFAHLLRNKIIIFQALLDYVEFDLSIKRNWRSSLVKTSTLSLVLVRVIA